MLIEPDQLLLFAVAALTLNLTPGSDMMFCLGQGLKSGPRAGLAASLGITTGGLIHVLLASLGLAALIGTYPVLFEAIRWLGIGYLTWLAVNTIRHIGTQSDAFEARALPPAKAWRQGMIVNLLNPKVAVFVLAFLPQFVDPARGSPFLQFLLLGAILNAGGAVVNGLVGVFAGRIGAVLATSRKVRIAFEAATACVFLGLAARLAFVQR